ncbi:Phosphoinositide phosphatase SAC7 [Capsicum annuum]|nr:Phosphoinositide phosphatase SAC7 [Capsicum annuum]
MTEKGDPSQKLYTRMRLWEFPDEYVVEPTDGSCGSCMEISRKDGSVKLIDEVPDCSSVRVPKIQKIFGVIGILKLLAGSYVLVITDRECVGTYFGHPIFKVSSLKFFPCDHSLVNSTAEEKKTEAQFKALLNVAETTPGLYFSYDVNITLSAQRLYDLGDETKMLPLWRQLDPFLLPVVQGSFHNFQAAVGKDILDVTLIARRCNRRAGTRMWRRGADSDGFVANFVESEQMIQLKSYTASFVQPRIVERHYLDLRKKYGNVLSIDLVNKHGGEGRLHQKFANAMQHVAGDDVRYLHFDFHHICGHVHFERLSILYDRIEDFFIKNRYFLISEKGEKVELQHGILRTNCIDCLDRTNVTQSMLGRKMLEFQLRRLGAFDAGESISSYPNLDESFKLLWANHGDDISIQYSGTPALKGDFVRFGHRTAQGVLADGCNALTRYYLNNFVDGTNQDAVDLLQGNYILSVSRDVKPSSQKESTETKASFPLALGLILTGLFFAMLSLRNVGHGLRNLIYAIVWASISLGIAAYVRANGQMFCNRPSLHQSRR